MERVSRLMIIDPNDQKKPLFHYLFKAEVAKRVFDGLEKGVSLVNSYLIISSLSVFSFGLYQLVLSFVSIVRGLGVNFFDGVVAIDMRRYFNILQLDKAKKLFKENIVFKMAVGFGLAVVVFFGADLVAGWYGEDVGTMIRWTSLLFITGSAQSLIGIFLQSIVSFSQQGLSAIRESLKLVLIAYFLVFQKFTITELIAIHVLVDLAATSAFGLFWVWKKYSKAFMGVVASAESIMMPLVKKEGRRIFIVFGLKEVLQNATPWLVKVFTSIEGVALYSLAVNLASFAQDFMPLTGLKSILALKADDLNQLKFIFARAVKYTFWLGVIFAIGSIFITPIIIKFIFPKYASAILIFQFMAAALPLYGVVKVTHATLASLREYGILARRLVNEVAILFLGSAILLPIVGVAGIGIVYLLRHLERTWFLYTRLIRKYPDFRIKIWRLFRIDATDRQFAKTFLSTIKWEK